MNGELQLRGTLKVKKLSPPSAPLIWRLHNKIRWGFVWGWIAVTLAKGLTKLTGIPTITSELRARVNRGGTVLRDADGNITRVVGGSWEDYGVLSRRLVTDTGVAFIVDAWQNIVELENMKYHGVGTGTTAEAANQTALVTESTTALNPDSTRATGVQTEPTANQLTSTGTVTFDNTAAVTEHSLFSQAATGGGVMWDRSVFAAVNVGAGDSIQFAYTATFTSGG